MPGGWEIYSSITLTIYDIIVHWWNDNYVWRCPLPVLSSFFAANVGPRHMDIGVGTGLFPVQHREQMRQRHQEWPQHLVLVDMNPSCLQKSAERIDCPSKTECVQASVFEPFTVPAGQGSLGASPKFDSISMMYLLHCLPPPTDHKATVFAHLKRHLTAEGTLFGATILGYGAQHNLLGRLTMRLYNWKGIFGNTDDNPEVFVKALENEFEEVETHIVGVVLLFRARKPRLA
ncbi:hypothetical protein AtubIFM55763_006765 [Aspergillus tubingensis]|uniref:Methyltransferase domain-containing protein n=2 Tax=Aspergillus subgen. Circumdati TaxID=2720871 RepID=A0A100IBZ8_ASPNG|nr:S-adenosyl-L-methionine dependent methyltransferase [Aspergillus tubingensis]GAQ37826.1 hypothetical protein AKAW_00986 [Aspergillus niger]GFN13118.1 S-adenosyl-L-methionine dependent methyltransferase [Aspergillus tubingensis]GLA56736.1 hypothetical protein AtubIFM54640_000394 [Aspergillus tubingensis]GLA75486.1 hypothetical protein AtubIFM55763_006765 [Aspergillus tubingensis]GLA82212.1 hypothetical protein AtubIFM56815_006393 [Aspergillus tubingensis]